MAAVSSAAYSHPQELATGSFAIYQLSSLSCFPERDALVGGICIENVFELFIYSPTKRLAAFQSGGGGPSSQADRPRRGHAVFVPGLTDGLLALDYVPSLVAAVDRLGLSLVQPVLSSSYKGYGTSSLRQDVEELDELLAYLLAKSHQEQPSPPSLASTSEKMSSSSGSSGSGRGDKNIVFIGHSTGCQDAVFYMKHGRPDLRARVRGVVLQAPVSDRDWRESLPETAGFVREARERLAAGRVAVAGKELMPTAAEADAPITVSRYLSLSTQDGDDDMFSSDLSFDERHFRLGHMASVPTAAFISGSDEYVPRGGKDGKDEVARSRSPETLAQNLRTVLLRQMSPESPTNVDCSKGSAVESSSSVCVIEGADHCLSDERHAREFVERVEAFVAALLKTEYEASR